MLLKVVWSLCQIPVSNIQVEHIELCADLLLGGDAHAVRVIERLCRTHVSTGITRISNPYP